MLEVTRDLIRIHGYADVTLDQISSGAGVAKSSLLWHFGSKEMLLAEAATTLFQQIGQEIAPDIRVEETPVRRLDRVFEQVAQAFTASPEAKGVVLGMLFSGSVRAEIRRGWDSHVQALVDAFSQPQRPMPAAMARLMLATFHGCYCHWYAGGCSEPIASYLEPARELFRTWLASAAA
ncbi:helix-turn-helix domain-containing protein [Cupriavidus sp. WKF15]|uniref:TetR/AcrR family transcriptional regulator n=1 Tax=Cupriavidus sp. WKF15 TaxID=3032282 RepID=UPI0031FEE92A